MRCVLVGHFNFVTSSSARATFVNDAVKLIEDYGFDGMYVRLSGHSVFYRLLNTN
jgi:chitinase